MPGGFGLAVNGSKQKSGKGGKSQEHPYQQQSVIQITNDLERALTADDRQVGLDLGEDGPPTF